VAKILIVEDDRAIVRILKLLLEANDHEVIGTAFNGRKGVDMYRSHLSEKPDVVIIS
jgi:YesN/AraC family two-component response regulator